MQRLYLQFYVTILIVLVVFVGAAVLLWRLADDDNRTPQYLDVAAELTGALLPEADAPRGEQQRAIEALHRKLRFDLALYRADGDMIAMAGTPPPRFEPRPRPHRLAARTGRADLHPAASRRPLAGGAPGARAAQPDLLDRGRPGAGRHRRSPSAPSPWCAASAAGWNG